MGKGIVVQLNISPAGVPKLPVREAHVGPLGLAGDGHADMENHGGPDRAVCLFAIERIEAIAAEGHPIGPGATGENITLRGIDWDTIQPGVRLRVGVDVVLEITRHAAPCKTNARWFKEGDFNRMNEKKFPGWSRVYAKVIATGWVRPGDAVELERSYR
jgi:MOSC domain-containing protein YiiM